MANTNYDSLITEATSRPTCDFCHKGKVVWRYPATDFLIPEVRWASVGDWAACDICAKYIEDSKLDELAFLVSGILALSNPEAQDLAGEHKDALHHLHYYWMRKLYREFSAHRKGERTKS